ncbi:MAG: recombinase family protein [Rickettsiaceae bacterium]|nr:recombinase family protein [Rickettsiaceae bacterium]
MRREIKQVTKAVILARVSSKDQEEGYSIEAQKHRLKEYCALKGLEVLKVFEFIESSTNGNRKQFNEAIEFTKKQKEIIAIITDKVDRLQRSYRETVLLEGLIAKEKIQLHFITENLIIHQESTSQEKMIWNMHVMIAQGYVDSLRDNVNRSIAQKLRNGEWIGTAPIGYLNIKGDGKRARHGTIIVDKLRAPLIKRLFEEYATGTHTIEEMRKRAKKWGLKNSRGSQGNLYLSHMHEIIQNPFYYGVMRVKKTGKQYPHIYPPIISKETFDACQKVRLGHNKKPFKYGAKEFVFRGLITCATTGKIASSDTKVKKYKNGEIGRWTYLIVWNPNNPNKKVFMKEDKIIEEVQKIFDEMKLEPEVLKKLTEMIRSSEDDQREYLNLRTKELNVESTKIKNRMDRLTDIFLDGDIDKETYEEKRKKFIERREEITEELSKMNEDNLEHQDHLIRCLELGSNAGKTFRGSNVDEKRELINLVFSNLRLKGRKLEFKLRPPFDAIIKSKKSGEWRTREDSNL